MNAFFGISSSYISTISGIDILPIDQWGILVEKTGLDSIEKISVQTRIIAVVKSLQTRLNQYSFAYTLLRTTTTIGSILIPALLAFQNVDSPQAINIGMWSVGLLVGLSNSFISLFKIDKNYFTLGELLDRIESESWMYITLSGRYRQKHSSGIDYTHKELFYLFMERCEYLLHKAVRTELQNNQQSQSSPNSVGNGGGVNNDISNSTPPPEFKSSSVNKGITHINNLEGNPPIEYLFTPQFKTHKNTEELHSGSPHHPIPRETDSFDSNNTGIPNDSSSGSSIISKAIDLTNEIVPASLEDEQFTSVDDRGASISNIRNPKYNPHDISYSTPRGRIP
jgi:peptidoglycan hydrolase-like protein with peptidoglycan-binding domain